ncbi:Transcriptional regulator, TetR family [Streptococcus sp. DD11]|uniref:TetR/AcrR family transcriptional regulator n=1 Tax=Streptococcus sp. DD11 TaxID=1777879 RepID=UPI0007975C1D|nr:TetR/AcrR family transcriptional regulator [Streptococcus sp. DD11]KXT81622.1 Transcriptional regulator, TetR family [Streptococcus sp. DD11]
MKKEGWQSLSLRKLTAQCQVSHAASYRHFENKNALLNALIPVISDHFAAYLKSGKQGVQTPREELVHLGYQFIGYCQDYPHLFDFLFFSPYALTTQFDEAGHLQLEMDVASFRYNREVIQRFIDSLNGHYDFNLAFMHLWSFILGISTLIRQGIYSSQTAGLSHIIETTFAFYQ